MKKILILCLIIVFAALGVIGYFASREPDPVVGSIVVENLNNAQKIEIYSALHSDGGQYDETKPPVLAITRTGTYDLEQGEYIYKASSTNQDLAPEFIKFYLEDTYKFSATLNYTETKLNQLLATEIAPAQAAMTSRFPSQMETYSIESPRLYIDGTWLAAKLIPKQDSEYLPILRIVLKKQGGAWTVATDPPKIILPIKENTSIPEEIIRDINNR